MARSIKMPFVATTLKKVREITGCTEEEAARRVGKDVETVRRWESQDFDDLPTLAQAKKLADLYRYSAGIFLFAELPDFIKVPEVHDFRSLPGGERLTRESWSRNLRYLIRHTENRQEFARSTIIRHETSFQPWVGSVAVNSTTIDELATNMREVLRVAPGETFVSGTVEKALNQWIRRFEDHAGVFVFQTDNVSYPIEIKEMRGISLADQHAPFIVLNSKDAHAGRIFTLFHEFAHLWLGTSGVSASERIAFMRSTNDDLQIERFCDGVAASALMPGNEFLGHWNQMSGSTIERKVSHLARGFRVSRHAVAVRALNLDRIQWNDYERLRDYFQNIGDASSGNKKTSESGGNYYATFKRNAGTKFINLVLGELYADEISVKEAGSLLGARVASVYRLAEYMDFTP